MKWKMLLFLTFILAVLTLVIHGAVRNDLDLLQLGLGCLALHVLVAWLIPSLRGESPAPEIPEQHRKARPSWEHN